MPGSQSIMIPLAWHLPLLAPTWWGPTGTTDRQRLTTCRSNSSSSSLSSSRVSYSSCSRSNRSSTTSNSSSCSISNNRWLKEPQRDAAYAHGWDLACEHIYRCSRATRGMNEPLSDGAVAEDQEGTSLRDSETACAKMLSLSSTNLISPDLFITFIQGLHGPLCCQIFL